MKIYRLLFILVILLMSFTTTQADSYYSVYGLGIPQYLVSSQSAGMGGAGLGVQQYLSYNSMNPAAVYLNNLTTISASFQAEISTNTIANEDVTTRQGNAAGFQFGIPMYKDKMAVLVSVKPLVKSQMTVDFAEQTEEFDLQRTISASGGITAASIGMNYKVLPSLTLGGLFNFNFGAYNEVWKTEFDNDTYLNTSDNIRTHVWGTGAELGLHFKPLKILSVGAMMKSSSNLSVETRKTTGGGVRLTPIEQTALYPTSVGGGIGVDLNKFLIAADIYTQLWKNYEIDGVKDESMANYLRIGGGLQFRGSDDYLAKYYQRVVLRLGMSYANLPFIDATGEQVTEMYFSGGAGFPFNNNAGRIDVALEYGKRSSSDAFPYSENIIRISASVTMAEKWFQRIY
jgi:hypothetical protein